MHSCLALFAILTPGKMAKLLCRSLSKWISCSPFHSSLYQHCIQRLGNKYMNNCPTTDFILQPNLPSVVANMVSKMLLPRNLLLQPRPLTTLARNSSRVLQSAGGKPFRPFTMTFTRRKLWVSHVSLLQNVERKSLTLRGKISSQPPQTRTIHQMHLVPT